MKRGKVKFFNEQKGFGFIVPEDGSKDIFVHNTQVNKNSRPLAKDDEVIYDEKDGKKGPEATNVEKA